MLQYCQPVLASYLQICSYSILLFVLIEMYFGSNFCIQYHIATILYSLLRFKQGNIIKHSNDASLCSVTFYHCYLINAPRALMVMILLT